MFRPLQERGPHGVMVIQGAQALQDRSSTRQKRPTSAHRTGLWAELRPAPCPSSAASPGSPFGHAVIAAVGRRACGSVLRGLRGPADVVEDLDDDLGFGNRGDQVAVRESRRLRSAAMPRSCIDGLERSVGQRGGFPETRCGWTGSRQSEVAEKSMILSCQREREPGNRGPCWGSRTGLAGGKSQRMASSTPASRILPGGLRLLLACIPAAGP